MAQAGTELLAKEIVSFGGIEGKEDRSRSVFPEAPVPQQHYCTVRSRNYWRTRLINSISLSSSFLALATTPTLGVK
jgi:hypothetical protein